MPAGAVPHVARGIGIGALAAAAAMAAAIALPGGPGSASAADPRAVLSAASVHAAATASPAPPDGDQFLYVETLDAAGRTGQYWLSLDGAHDGLLVRPDLTTAGIPVPGCIDGRQQDVANWQLTGTSHPCVPIGAYDPSLPSDAAGIAAYLDAKVGRLPDGSPSIPSALVPQLKAKAVISLLQFSYMTAGQRAAVLQVVSQLPGLTATEGATDPAGRTGTRIAWNAEAGPGSLPYSGSFVVDPDTGALLSTDDGPALISQAVVDQVGMTG